MPRACAPGSWLVVCAPARLLERLQQRGRALSSAADRRANGTEVYTTATELHYDAETGTFWSEDGSMDARANAARGTDT